MKRTAADMVADMRAAAARLEAAVAAELAIGASPRAAADAADRTTRGEFTRARVLLAVSKVYRASKRWLTGASRAELAELLSLESEAVVACGLRAASDAGAAPRRLSTVDRLESLVRFATAVGADDEQLERDLADVVAARRSAAQLVTLAIDQGLGPVDTIRWVRDRATETDDRIIVSVTLEAFRSQRLTGSRRDELAIIDEIVVAVGDLAETTDDVDTLQLIVNAATTN